jgi:hypothetical protein
MFRGSNLLSAVPARANGHTAPNHSRDGLGSTTELTDENSQVVVAYEYDVFGTLRGQSGANDNVWIFTGQQRDLVVASGGQAGEQLPACSNRGGLYY